MCFDSGKGGKKKGNFVNKLIARVWGSGGGDLEEVERRSMVPVGHVEEGNWRGDEK